jgi:integrase
MSPGRRTSSLPPRLRARPRGKKVFYYYDAGGKPRREIALGSDYGAACRKWAEYEALGAPHETTFPDLAKRYKRDEIPKKAPRTQRDNEKELDKLLEFFGDPPAPLDQITPVHVRQYLDWRGAPVRANREIALFSHMFNRAREWGLTIHSNPCAGVRKHRELGREVYVTDVQYKAVWEVADEPLRNAMDLAYLTGQRPADVLRMTVDDLSDDHLNVRQGKTGKKLRIALTGELLDLVQRLKRYREQRSALSAQLVVLEDGSAMGYVTLRSRFDRARRKVPGAAWQLRDLRAKAASDKADAAPLLDVRDQLGHGSVKMTEHYVRGRRGKKVTPTR